MLYNTLLPLCHFLRVCTFCARHTSDHRTSHPQDLLHLVTGKGELPFLPPPPPPAPMLPPPSPPPRSTDRTGERRYGDKRIAVHAGDGPSSGEADKENDTASVNHGGIISSAPMTAATGPAVSRNYRELPSKARRQDVGSSSLPQTTPFSSCAASKRKSAPPLKEDPVVCRKEIKE